MRSALSALVLVAFAASPCLAKEHAPHGSRAGATGNEASGKAASRANPAPSKGNPSINGETAVAPPVLPPHGVAHRHFRIVTPGIKPVGLGNPSHNTNAMLSAPIARNAIGQPFASAKTLAGTQPPAPASQRAVALPPPAPATAVALPASSASARLANATNRGSINGATMVRPVAGPSLIGGPAQVRYGINGTTVQNRR